MTMSGKFRNKNNINNNNSGNPLTSRRTDGGNKRKIKPKTFQSKDYLLCSNAAEQPTHAYVARYEYA